jgi:hypothetical protein
MILLYHWSPTDRRGQINKYGFRPSMRSVDGLWKPPYVCFSDSPSLAWGLSGAFHPEIHSWDLWMTDTTCVSGYETIMFDRDRTEPERVKEYRIYERIFKRDIWYVATRTQEGAA